MRGLLNAIKIESNVEDSVKEYKGTISEWNTSIHSWFAKMTFLIDWNTTLSLESDVHGRFVAVGGKLEALIRDYRRDGQVSGRAIASVDAALNALAGQIDRFLKRILKHIKNRREIVKNGKRLFYRLEDLPEYTTFDLVKTLFVSDVDRINIIRPS
jgi:hypothetical protein